MKETIIVAILLVLIIGLAILYVVRERKKGRKCIGCPDVKNCPSAKDGGCSSCTMKK